MSSASPPESRAKLSTEELATLVSALQAEVLGIKTRLCEREVQIGSLEETIANLAHENELLKRRLYGNKTERLKTSEQQLALGDLLADEKQLQKQLDDALAKAKPEADSDGALPPEKTKAKPKGRRDLSTSAPLVSEAPASLPTSSLGDIATSQNACACRPLPHSRQTKSTFLVKGATRVDSCTVSSSGAHGNPL